MNKQLLILIIVIFLIYFFNNRRVENFSKNINTLNDLDKFLYINLSNGVDRKEQIEKEFQKIKIPKNKIFRIDAVYDKTNGHLGCAKSHIKALKYAKNNNLENVVIFEDDFVFTKSKEEIDKLIKKFIGNFNDNWDVLMLKCSYNSLSEINNFSNFKKVNWTTGAMAYIVNKHYIDTLLNNFTDSKNKMEEEMKNYNYVKNGKKFETENAIDQNWQSLQKKDKWYIFYPFIGDHKDLGSSIMNKNVEQFSNGISIINL